MTSLQGKTALVTGASRGIGRASALALAKAGAQVVVHYGSGAAEAQAVVAEIRSAGGRADAVQADLGAADGPHGAGPIVPWKSFSTSSHARSVCPASRFLPKRYASIASAPGWRCPSLPSSHCFPGGRHAEKISTSSMSCARRTLLKSWSARTRRRNHERCQGQHQ